MPYNNPYLPNNGLGLYPNTYGGYAGAPASGVINTNPPTTSQVTIPHVHGEEGARAYTLAPNSSVLLLDETDNIVWYKGTDSAGYATITGYRITPIEKTAPKAESQTYVTKDEFDKLAARFDKLMEELGDGKSNS